MKPFVRYLAALLLGVLIGYLVPIATNALGSTAHVAVANKLVVRETDKDVQYTLASRCVYSGTPAYGAFSVGWTVGKAYPCTLWVFSRSSGDVSCVIKIFGPSDDGLTYEVQVSRVSSYAVNIYYDGVLKLQFPALGAFPEGQAFTGFGRFTVTA